MGVDTVAGSEPGLLDGIGTAAQFDEPTGIVADAAGDFFLCDTQNSAIRRIDASTEAVTTVAGGTVGYADGLGAAAQFDEPMGVAMDATGDLYVADTGNDCIRVIAPGGSVTTLAGSPGQAGLTDGVGSAARFDAPAALTFDPSSNAIYVADTGNHCVRRVSLAGVVQTIAGNGQYGDADGNGASARFDGPMGIAVDASGNLFVSDTNNNDIREIDPSGEVTTIAGSGWSGNYDGPGALAEFDHPAGLIVLGPGDLAVCDTDNDRVREVHLP